MQEILTERERITKKQQRSGGPTEQSTTPAPVTAQLRQTPLFAKNQNASVVWHTADDEQALENILRLIDQAPTRPDQDPAYDDAVTFLRNLKDSYADTPQGLLLRDQLRATTNWEALERLQYVLDRLPP